MQDVSRGEGRTVLFVSHNMASIRALCKTGVLLENGCVKSMGEINDVVDQYLGNAVRLDGEPIIDSFKIHDKNLTVDSVVVNGQTTNKLDLRWPARTIDVVVRGKYEGDIPMDLELCIFTDNEVLVAKRTPSLSSGITTRVNNDSFELHESLTLPEGFTNGVYFLRIDITHPKVSYLAQANNAVQINIDGNYTPQGIPVDQRYFGMLYL